MKLHRASLRDVQHILSVTGHPEVKGLIQSPFPLTAGHVARALTRVRIYVYDGGVIAFEDKGMNIYEGHVAAVPGFRGRWLDEACRGALDDMFSAPDVLARAVEARRPKGRPDVGMLLRRLGFERHSTERGVVRYMLTRDRWVEIEAASLCAAGVA